MTPTSPRQQRASPRSDDFELPLYHRYSSSSFSHPPTPPPSVPNSSTIDAPEPDLFSSPESLLPLFPVHHLILHHLADLAPTKALTLSHYTYDVLSPYVYQHATASNSLLAGLDLKWGYERKLKALKCVERLTLKDKEGTWAVAMLSHASNEPRQYEGVFSGVRVLETSREVREGGYHELKGANDTRIEYQEVLERIEAQLGHEWKEEKLREETGWDAQSAYFEIEEAALYNPFPVPPVPQNVSVPFSFKAWRDKAVPIFFGGVITVLPFLLLLFASLATVPIHRYSIATISSNWVVETGPEGNVTVPVKVNFGVASGCIWYNHTGPMCSTALPWIPDPDLLHLPSNQTLTSCIPTTTSRGLFVLHVATGLGAITTVWAYFDMPNMSKGFTKRAHWSICGVALIAWMNFWIVLSFDVDLKTKIQKEGGQGMGYEYHTGQATWLVLTGALFQSLWAFATNS
ncbi:hypothetical protein IAT38_000946 [Cryptococcus sp. DSM 104549]